MIKYLVYILILNQNIQIQKVNNKKYKILIPEYAIGFDNKNYILIGNNNKDNNGIYYSDNIINDKQLINGEKVYEFSKNSELTEGSGKLIELEIFEINQN